MLCQVLLPSSIGGSDHGQPILLTSAPRLARLGAVR